MNLVRVTASLAALSALLGIAHIVLAAYFYSAWTVEALWFVGTGLAIVVGALANGLTLDYSGPATGFILSFINTAMAALFLSAWLVLPAPQIVVGGVLFTALLVCGILRHLLIGAPLKT